MFERASTLPPRTLAAFAAGIALAFGMVGFTAPWHLLELKGFDLLTRATAPQRSSVPITIVGIDESSFQQVGRQWPWPRQVYAKAIEEIRRSGALVIGVDVLLDKPSNLGPGDDRALAQAIAKAGNVVVASDRIYEETALSRRWLRVDPLPEFVEAGAQNGYVKVELDPDLVVRRVPHADDAFWTKIAARLEALQPGLAHVAAPGPGAMVRYVGADHTFPYVSFYQVLDAGKYLPANAFEGQIVLIGRDIQASVDARAAQSDLFFSPFTGDSGGLMPGVELHANFLETAFRGAAIRPAPPAVPPLVVLAMVALCFATMRRWRPLASGALAAALVAALGAADWALFQRFNLWLPVFAAASSVAAMYLAYGGIAFVIERRRRSEIRRAFSLYVSPEVVDHVMAHPESLGLGGERREVTMMFTDLQGFTTLSEQLEPEQVARILNEHFTRATAIVKRHGGTVNRFIGDSVMAMWGAPLDDSEQAAHALAAACEMQKDMESLRAELVARGLPPIHMRVGVHSCVAVIGNLGSSDRFDYTAIGDGVNLAARLEGVNKLYRTGILASGVTVEKARGAVPMRVVDRVIVKGKTQPVEIFTPCADAAVVEANAAAVRAYRARQWDESERRWREVLARVPEDAIALLYLDRIRSCRTVAPGVDWQDAVELEKL